ncbi:MAG: beta-Ala-His dipeptidase [Lachnospiraceae bacterium]|jgi:dipeptidase D|nr:beta-Ala-His dipeptidase [Lachnospiraceae bacterium]
MESSYEKLKKMDFYKYFKDISNIPRGSGNEEAVHNYIINFAKEHGLEYKADNNFNVIIYKDGVGTGKDKDAVMLQGHLDMVCEKIAASNHDFMKDPIEIYEKDGYLTAKETTLGADNGIAVAYSLAVLSNNLENCPPIEALFTTNEEVGMEGMKAVDNSWIYSNKMINLDSEEEGMLTTSCAGGSRFILSRKLNYTANKENNTGYHIEISGLLGGHSGNDINKGRGNSIILLGRLLFELKERFNIRISSLGGGSKMNAIPIFSFADIWFSGEDKKEIEDYIHTFLNSIKLEYSKFDPEINVSLSPVKIENKPNVMDKNTLEDILDLIFFMPNGLILNSPYEENTTLSSSNMGVLMINNDMIEIQGLARSNVNSKIYNIIGIIQRICNRTNFEYTKGSSYPAWEPNENSEFQKIAKAVYKEQYGKDMVSTSMHGGLECALMIEKKPDMDMIAIGPTILEVHTVHERADITSLVDTWEYILALLQELAK